MKLRKLKLRFPGTVQTAEQASETTPLSCTTSGDQSTNANRAGDGMRLTDLMIGLQKLLGTTLSGIAVGVQVGNILICAAMMLLGPAVILGLLPE
jgi:hypothetical protein